MFDGFYKCEYRAGSVLNRSVMHVASGRMLGGNSAFAHVGTYEENDGVVIGRVAGQRHAVDPHVGQLYGADDDELIIHGHAIGDTYHLEATPVRLPGSVVMKSVMTRLDGDSLPSPGLVGEGGITNGLYSVRMRTLDGIDGGLTGVMLLQNGRVLGGDAFFYYLGSYSSADGRWKGEIVNQEHTAAGDAIFGGREVGIGFFRPLRWPKCKMGSDGLYRQAQFATGRRSHTAAPYLGLPLTCRN